MASPSPTSRKLTCSLPSGMLKAAIQTKLAIIISGGTTHFGGNLGIEEAILVMTGFVEFESPVRKVAVCWRRLKIHRLKPSPR